MTSSLHLQADIKRIHIVNVEGGRVNIGMAAMDRPKPAGNQTVTVANQPTSTFGSPVVKGGDQP